MVEKTTVRFPEGRFKTILTEGFFMENFVIEDGVLKEYTGPGGEIVIPAGVTEIGWSAFEGCTGLTSVVIPEGVTRIGNFAFYGCTGLTSVVIHGSLKGIASNSFEDCTGLVSVTIPDGITVIENSMFAHCTGLTSVSIPDSVTKIKWGAFRNCIGLVSVTIPESVMCRLTMAHSTAAAISRSAPLRSSTQKSMVYSGCHGINSVDRTTFGV